jgi:hypothetical protein
MTYRILVGKPEGKRPLGRLRRRWVDNINVDLIVIGWDGMDWIDLAQDRDQWMGLIYKVMNFRVSVNFGKFSSSCTTGVFSRRAQLHGVSYVVFIISCVNFSQYLEAPQTERLAFM